MRPRKLLILASLLGGALVLAPAALLAQDEMARGSLFERLNLDRLRLTSLGLGFGYVKPSQIDPTTSVTVHADYGEIAPKWRVVFSATYWGSEYDDKTISTLESALNKAIASQGGTDSIRVGRVTVSDIALATDLRYTPLPHATLRPYVGGGLSVHVINAEGRVIDGTLFERSLDNITAGIAGVAGVDLVLLRNFRVGVLGRYDLLSAARFPTARVTVAYVFGAQSAPGVQRGP